jgi:non-ribosomal peptide synthetase component F
VRLLSIVQQTNSSCLLCSASEALLASRLTALKPTVISEESFDTFQQAVCDVTYKIVSSDALYVVFTSGSPGTPKGVVISHSNFARAAYYQKGLLRFTSSSRIYDYASYAFDVSWSNFLHALTASACLCIPSDYERKTAICESM